MEIPIYIDGAAAGRLFLEKQGCCTLIRGEMKDPGRLVRLYIYGEGESYLGVPQPEGGRLIFRRKLTPRETGALPRRPEYAAEHRQECSIPAEVKADEPEEKRHVLWQGGRPYYF